MKGTLTHQVAYIEHTRESRGHWVMFDGHEQRVHNDTYGDPQVHKWVHDD